MRDVPVVFAHGRPTVPAALAGAADPGLPRRRGAQRCALGRDAAQRRPGPAGAADARCWHPSASCCRSSAMLAFCRRQPAGARSGRGGRRRRAHRGPRAAARSTSRSASWCRSWPCTRSYGLLGRTSCGIATSRRPTSLHPEPPLRRRSTQTARPVRHLLAAGRRADRARRVVVRFCWASGRAPDPPRRAGLRRVPSSRSTTSPSWPASSSSSGQRAARGSGPGGGPVAPGRVRRGRGLPRVRSPVPSGGWSTEPRTSPARSQVVVVPVGVAGAGAVVLGYKVIERRDPGRCRPRTSSAASSRSFWVDVKERFSSAVRAASGCSRQRGSRRCWSSAWCSCS